MREPRKYLQQPEANPYPHMGHLLGKRIREKKIVRAALARKIGVADTGVTRYLAQPSLQMAIIWKVGLAMGHNFFAELSDAFPVQVPDEALAATQQAADALIKAQLAEKDQRIADLEKELAIYKGIVMGGKGA